MNEIMATKSTSTITVTLDQELFDDENGIPVIRRILKEGEDILYEDVIKVSGRYYSCPLWKFLKWIHIIKNPDEAEVEPERFWGTYTIAGCENDSERPIIVNPLDIDGLVRID